MSIIDTVLNRFGFVSQSQLTARIGEAVKRELEKVERWQADTADAQRWTLPAPEIFANQADLYRLSPDLGTALDVLSNDIATAKFNVKRMRGEDLIDIPNHEFELLLRNPNPMDSGLELMRDTVCNYKLNGNAIWWLNREDEFAKVDEIWAIPYQMIKPVPDGRLYLSHYEYFPGESKPALRFETWEIIHFKTYNPKSRFWGLSPLESLVTTIAGNLGKRKTSKETYVDHNGNPNGILAFKDFPSNEAWNDIKEEKRQAAKRNEMMMLRGVGDGVTWLQRATSNKDAEYIASLQQDMTDIFNRICPGLLAMLSETATEANALAASAFYDDKTLWPLMETIAQKVTPQILPAYGIKLVGVYDDPRYVDKKLKLEEQKQYSLTHTVDAINKEYYQEDPIGDERGELFIAQITPESGGIQKPEPQPIPQTPPLLESPEDEIVDSPAEEMPIMDTGAEDVTAKAAIDELQKWRKMALRGKAKAQEFKSDYIPLVTANAIKNKLTMFTDKDTIARIFDGHIEAMKPKPKPKLDNPALVMLAESIQQAIQAAKAQDLSVKQDGFLETIKGLVETNNRTPNIYLTPSFTVPPAQHQTNITMPETPAPLTYVNITPNIEAPKPADTHIDAPVYISQNIEQPAAPVVESYVTNNFETPAPVVNVTPSIKLEEMPAQEIIFSPTINPPEIINQNNIVVQPAESVNQINVPPAEITVNNEIKTPKLKRSKTRKTIERDPDKNIESTSDVTDYDYEE